MWDTLGQYAYLIVIGTLVLVTLYNGHDTERGKACIAVLWWSVPMYWIYDTESIYTAMVDTFGVYGVESLPLLFAICTLSFIRCKLSTVLMTLFSMLILANCWFWWLEGFGHEVYEAQQSIVWAVFVIEVVMMLSKRLTDGVHGGLYRDRLAANITTSGMASKHSNLCNNSYMGTNQK